MKRSLLLVAALLFGTVLSAQDFDSAIKRWNDGPLTWDDFSLYSGGYPIISSMDYSWHGQQASYKTGNLKVIRMQTECYMNPVASWVNPEYRNPETLRYQQVAFDHAELCRRQLQRELDGNVNGHTASELSQFYYSKADRFIARLREETDQGRDTAMVRFFQIQVQEQLDSLQEEGVEPGFRKGNWGFGMHLGYGNEFRLGGAAGYLRPLHGVHWGFDVSYKKVYFYWHMLLAGGGRTRQDFMHEGNLWQAGKGQGGGTMEFDLAVPVVDGPWLRVAPFAGAGFGFVSTVVGKDASGKDKSDGIGGFRFLAGLSIDLKYLRVLDISSRPVYYYGVPIGTSRSYSENSVRLLAYAARTSTDLPVGTSWSLNFGLVYNIHSWNLR